MDLLVICRFIFLWLGCDWVIAQIPAHRLKYQVILRVWVWVFDLNDLYFFILTNEHNAA